MNITEILLGALLIVGAALGIWVIPYVKTHMTAEQINILVGIAQTVVYAAEKIFGAKMGKDKLAYALKLAQEELNKKGIKFDEEVIRAAIEAQVQKLGFDKAAAETPTVAVTAVPAQEGQAQ